jgi:adenylyl- and sulfurtransferase ThiI
MTDAHSPRPAVLLLSGGVDSTTLLALAVKQGFLVHALSFRYGQRHELEVQAATRPRSVWSAGTSFWTSTSARLVARRSPGRRNPEGPAAGPG